MAISPKTPGIHHINLRCLDLDETKKFYRDVIGFPIVLENDQLFAFPVGNVLLFSKKLMAKHNIIRSLLAQTI